MKFGVGTSHHKHAKTAVSDAVKMAKDNSGIEDVSFAFVFSTVGYVQEQLVASLKEELNDAPFCGCSGVGVIGPNFTNEDNFALSVMLFSGDKISFHTKCFEDLKDHDEEVGGQIANWTNQFENNSKAIFLFPEGLTCNYDALIRGFEGHSSKNLPLFGGFSGDNFLMRQTYQYCNGKVYSNSIVATVLTGDVNLAWGVTHGCSPIGEVRTITKVDKNIIYEIDNKPVLDVLKEYLTEQDIDNWRSTVANICLGFKANNEMKDSYDEFIIRFMPSKDDDMGSVTIPTEVEEGSEVWMTRRDQERIENGVEKIIEDISKKSEGKKPIAVFHFDCAGRGKMVMSTEKKENIIKNLQNNIKGKDVWSGFYTFGEMAPVNGKNCFHNYTAVILALYE